MKIMDNSREGKMNENETNYWVVGASWGGVKHQDESFLSKGIWMLGWEKEDQKSQFEKAEKIKLGDRIAIKKMKGKGSSEIKICHLGIVKGVILDTNKVICTVDWVVKNMNRNVESKGCFKSIHGPFTHDEWVQEVFCL